MKDIIKIAIVDDETLFLEGLKMILASVSEIKIVFTARNGQDFMDKIDVLEDHDIPDIALIDIQMEPINGFELVELLKINRPQLKLIILSSHYKQNVLGHMVKLGVSAFIPKNSSKESLLKVLKSVHHCGVYLTVQDQQLLLSYVKGKSKKPTFSAKEELSKREIEVLQLICQEKTNQEIASNLFISVRTVEGHRQRIQQKVGAKNGVGLVIFAIAHEIYSIPNGI